MKTIRDFDDALHYVYHLGFAGNPTNNIAQRQRDLCEVADKLLAASGQAATGWYQPAPFRVLFKTHRAVPGGYCFPWLGTFTIWPGNRQPPVTMRPLEEEV